MVLTRKRQILSFEVILCYLKTILYLSNMDANAIDLMDFEDLELIETPQRPIKHRLRVDPFELCDEDFRSKYRFTKHFGTEIVRLLKDNLTNDSRGGSLTPKIQVACALRSWARHEVSSIQMYIYHVYSFRIMKIKRVLFNFCIDQDDTADLHGVSQPVVSIVCKKVAEALAKISHKYIKMPAYLQEQEETMRKFRSIANMPTVIGAIDCTHIRVKKIRGDSGQLYINRKGFPSINVQVVCDADQKIMDIVTRWRGSVHDSRIFRESRIKQRFEAGAFSGLLLGDSGYPCTTFLFTPIHNPTTPQEERYNRSHILTRNTVERCFGLWKQRFRCLLRGMYGNIKTCKKTIVACAVLHNIAIGMREGIFPIDHGQNELHLNLGQPTIQPYIVNTVHGTIRRRQYIENHFSM